MAKKKTTRGLSRELKGMKGLYNTLDIEASKLRMTTKQQADKIGDLQKRTDQQRKQMDVLNNDVNTLTNERNAARSATAFAECERIIMQCIMLLEPHDYVLARQQYDLQNQQDGGNYSSDYVHAVNESDIVIKIAMFRKLRPYLFKIGE